MKVSVTAAYYKLIIAPILHTRKVYEGIETVWNNEQSSSKKCSKKKHRKTNPYRKMKQFCSVSI